MHLPVTFIKFQAHGVSPFLQSLRLWHGVLLIPGHSTKLPEVKTEDNSAVIFQHHHNNAQSILSEFSDPLP